MQPSQDDFYAMQQETSESAGFFSKPSQEDDMISFGDSQPSPKEIGELSTVDEMLYYSIINLRSEFPDGPALPKTSGDGDQLPVDAQSPPASIPVAEIRRKTARTRRNRRKNKQSRQNQTNGTGNFRHSSSPLNKNITITSPVAQLGAFCDVISAMRRGLHGGNGSLNYFAEAIRNMTVAPDFGPDEIAFSCIQIGQACNAILCLPDIARYFSPQYEKRAGAPKRR